MKNALILLAGGIGKRTGYNEPKQFIRIGNTNLIDYFLSNLDYRIFDIIVIASNKKNIIKYLQQIKNIYPKHNIIFSLSGNTRQLSVKNSLKLLTKHNPKKVLIHDSARPLVSNKLIRKIIKALDSNSNCIPYIMHNDLIKIKNNINNISKNQILNIQTPQGFIYKNILKAHNDTKKNNAKDDSTLIEELNKKIKFTRGEITNLKITNKEDLDYFNRIRIKSFKSGIGYDIHKIDFKSKKKLTLCGVKIKHPPLIGHSDADVGYHAVCDSILGSLSMKDIGYYFNNKNSKWKNANSEIFIKFCYQKLINSGYKIANLDINFICESPNIKKNSTLMIKNLSKLLKTSAKRISIKATTNEKISLIGKGEGIAAESIVQIVNV